MGSFKVQVAAAAAVGAAKSMVLVTAAAAIPRFRSTTAQQAEVVASGFGGELESEWTDEPVDDGTSFLVSTMMAPNNDTQQLDRGQVPKAEFVTEDLHFYNTSSKKAVVVPIVEVEKSSASLVPYSIGGGPLL